MCVDMGVQYVYKCTHEYVGKRPKIVVSFWCLNIGVFTFFYSCFSVFQVFYDVQL